MKFIFELLTSPLSLPIAWYLEYLIIWTVSRVVYKVAFSMVGDLYDDGINVGRAQTATMEYFAIKTIVIDGVTCHYLQTVQGELQNRT